MSDAAQQTPQQTPQQTQVPVSRYWVEVLANGQIQTCAMVYGDDPPAPIFGGICHQVDRFYRPSQHWWVDDQVEYIGDPPSPNHQFNPTVPGWEDATTLDQAKAAKWAEIKAERDAIEYGPFTYNGMTFDGDVDAQRRLNYCIAQAKEAQKAGWVFSIEFTLADNRVVMLEGQDFLTIELVKGEQVMGAFAHAVALRQMLDLASTIDAVQAIHWTLP